MKTSFIRHVSVKSLQASLKQSFRTALGTHDRLENLLVCIQLQNGVKGYGEAAIAPHITGETVSRTRKNLKAFKKNLLGQDVFDYPEISLDLHGRFPDNKSAIAAVEMALLDALTRHQRIPLWKFFAKSCRILQTDITLVIADLKETEDNIRRYSRQGFRTFKVKIGRDPDLDFQRVCAVQQLAPRVKIILDANQGYSAGETLKFLKSLERYRIKPVLIEQPVPKNDREGLKKVARLSKIPVCADESVSSYKDALWLIKEKAAHVFNIKLMKFGLLEAVEVARLARKFGIKLMIGGMMETSLAMTAAAHMAAGLGGFDFVDLDTPYFVKNDFEQNPYLDSKGIYNLRKVKSGIGIVPEGGV